MNSIFQLRTGLLGVSIAASFLSACSPSGNRSGTGVAGLRSLIPATTQSPGGDAPPPNSSNTTTTPVVAPPRGTPVVTTPPPSTPGLTGTDVTLPISITTGSNGILQPVSVTPADPDSDYTCSFDIASGNISGNRKVILPSTTINGTARRSVAQETWVPIYQGGNGGSGILEATGGPVSSFLVLIQAGSSKVTCDLMLPISNTAGDHHQVVGLSTLSVAGNMIQEQGWPLQNMVPSPVSTGFYFPALIAANESQGCEWHSGGTHSFWGFDCSWSTGPAVASNNIFSGTTIIARPGDGYKSWYRIRSASKAAFEISGQIIPDRTGSAPIFFSEIGLRAMGAGYFSGSNAANLDRIQYKRDFDSYIRY